MKHKNQNHEKKIAFVIFDTICIMQYPNICSVNSMIVLRKKHYITKIQYQKQWYLKGFEKLSSNIDKNNMLVKL